MTIGFAPRRMATYKRAGLLLSDLERLTQLVNDPDRSRAAHLRGQGPIPPTDPARA